MRFEPGARQGNDVIPLSVPEIHGNEWEYVKDCLDTGWVSPVGSFVDRFEQSVASCVGSRFAVATVNGTAALHIGLLVAGVEPDDEVLVSDMTFVAPANAIRYVGAWPVFIDAEPRHWQMDTDKAVAFLERCCTREGEALRNRRTGRRVRAVLPVHILGHPCDLDPLIEIADRFDLVVIEDATESLGARYKGKRVGAIGKIGCFSFNGNKIITTGGGGMLVTDDESLAHKARYLTTQAKDDPIEHFHREIGYNYRLSNVLAAIGCAQMEQLDRYVQKKRSIARRYDDAFSRIPGITIPARAEWAESIDWMYTILVDAEAFGRSSRELMRELEVQKIQSRPLWTPMHQLPSFAQCEAHAIAESPRLHETALSLPCSVGLTDAEADRVIGAVTSLSQEHYEATFP